MNRARLETIRHGVRRGLTALELLVATALASMLMVSILGVQATMNEHCRQLTQKSRTDPWQRLLAEQFRRDLANTRHIASGENRIVLSGYLGTEGSELSANLRAAEVTYYIAEVGPLACLLRDERSLAVVTSAVSSRRMLVVGVSQLKLVLPGASDADEDYSGPVPASCRVQVRDNTSVEPIAEVLWCQ